MLAYPQNLRRCKPGHRQIGGAREKIRHTRTKFASLKAAAAVIPQDCGAQNTSLAIEKHRAVLLAGKADGLQPLKT